MDAARALIGTPYPPAPLPLPLPLSLALTLSSPHFIGQEKYHSLAPMYYRGAAAAIIVYDITKASSFNTLKSWVEELQQLGPENIVIALCGNKTDLEDKRVRKCGGVGLAYLVALTPDPPPPQEVSTAEARAYAEEIGGSLFIETSAKSNKSVQDVFIGISHRLPKPQEANFGDIADLRAKSKKTDKRDMGCC